MTKEVILTPLAEINYENIAAYLFNKWGVNVVDHFIRRFEDCCGFLAEHPEIYPFIDKTQQIRKCVLTKHNTIYFKEYPDKIMILTIFDTRQDPDKLNILV
jgi:plasmid stabilization system protein ParE